MPGLFNRRDTDPEDAPIGGPSTEPRADDALLRPHSLTQELLEWLTAALEAVIQTPEVRTMADKRVRTSLHDAYKYADYLWPKTVEVQRAARLHELEHWPTGVTLAEAEAEPGSPGSVRPG